jgi:uncharacterized repeat protein (TIGR03917 family)
MIASRIPDPDARLSAGWAPPTEPPMPTVQLFARNAGPLGEHELVLSPGATAQDVSSALVLVPPDAALVEFGGDIDLFVIFREIPRPRSGRERHTGEPAMGEAAKREPAREDESGEAPAAADAR